MYCLSGGCWIGSRWITLEFYLGPLLEISWESGCLGLWEFLPVGLILFVSLRFCALQPSSHSF